MESKQVIALVLAMALLGIVGLWLLDEGCEGRGGGYLNWDKGYPVKECVL